MRKALSVLSMILLCSTAATAEPLVLEKAGNTHEAGILEAGLGDISYQTDLTEFSSGSKLTVNSTVISLFSRYAFSEELEAALTVPNMTISAKSETGGTSATTDDSGLGDAKAALKYNFGQCGKCSWLVSAGLALSLPTGKQSVKLPESFRHGLDMKPVFAASKMYDKYAVNLNLSYDITAEYEDASAAKTKQNPGDVLSAGAGIEYPVNEKLSLLGEFVYNSLSEAKSAGTAVSGSSGSQTDLVCGVRYDKNSFRTKLAVALSFGDEKYRTYDYKIITGITYLWKI